MPSHLPVFSFDGTSGLWADVGSASGQRGLHLVVEMLADKMVLQFPVLVLGGGEEPADHADVSSAGDDASALRHLVARLSPILTTQCGSLFFSLEGEGSVGLQKSL